MLSLDINTLSRNAIIIIIASFVVMLTSIFTLLVISMYIISIFWENHRNAAFISVIFVYLAITILGIVVLINRKKKTSVFENTINEFDNSKKKLSL
jgi:uncharacterized membrane protein YqjE